MEKVIQYRGHKIASHVTRRVQDYLGGSQVIEEDHVTIDGVDVTNDMPLVGGVDEQMKYAETMVDNLILEQIEKKCASMSLTELINYHRKVNQEADMTEDKKNKYNLESASRVIFDQIIRSNNRSTPSEQEMLTVYTREIDSKSEN